MPTSLDPKLVCGLALALIIGSRVGMAPATGKALSANVGIGSVGTQIILSLIGAGFLKHALVNRVNKHSKRLDLNIPFGVLSLVAIRSHRSIVQRGRNK
ncbi:hypothetical protein [Candidatus Accumulibacter sp. ACC003]|uniref:hypothetical protein n=1 Tax=Candidatus Accumulibacter sp. ACC003 TaxID=2823334 RepID=UPI0025BE812C|nr:hypothetical protein [Candidatus Accumulibacter sp. ACC003]